MVHTGIFATAAECASKVGAMKDTNGWTEANINQWCAESESFINVSTRFNWSDNYGTLNTDVKKILTEISSDLVAIYGINYNMSTFGAYREAEDMVNILRDAILRGISILRDKKSQDFINGA